MSKRNDWALILGASSGFGAATSLKLANDGLNIFGVHLDRRATMPKVEALRARIEATGRRACFFNINAAAEEKRQTVVAQISEEMQPTEQVRLLMHSIAFGTLKPLIAQMPADRIDKRSLDMTIDVMANSLVYWVQALVADDLMGSGGRIVAMTSAGSRVIWNSYGAVSAAKCALESHCRQLAVELAPRGITANAILAGVTETPALQKIPGSRQMVDSALARHPRGRLTQPDDVANAISLLCRPEADWITGNTILVDGGETIAG